MDNTERAARYAASLKLEAEAEKKRSSLLLRQCVIDRIAQFVDRNRRGIHIDVNGRCGELAAITAVQTQRKVIALMRNPFSAENALDTIAAAGLEAEPNIHAQVRADGAPLSLGYVLSVNTMMDMDMRNTGAVAVICDNIRTATVLDSLLQDTPVTSMAWSFPRYHEDICAAEFPALPPRDAVSRVMTLEREHLLRYATIRMAPGSQLVLAGDARFEETGGRPENASVAQERQHRCMAHWQPYWKKGKAFSVKTVNGESWTTIGQQGNHFNGVTILEYRRNEKCLNGDALEASNRAIGLE